MVALRYFIGSDAFFLGAYGDGGTVAVAAGYHEYVIAGHAVIAGKLVGGQITSGYVAQMKRAVGVRPGNSQENISGHKAFSIR